MATTRLQDVVVPAQFSQYITQHSMESTALMASGIVLRNAVIDAYLKAGAESFVIPSWLDLGNAEADVSNDDPQDFSVPQNIGTAKQVVRKSFLHQSWSQMNLASELAGASAIEAIKTRVTAYWDRQAQRRLVATLKGVFADNIAANAGDMVLDVSGLAGGAEKFGAAAVIDATASLGDAMGTVVGIAMHSNIFRAALKADLIDSVQASDGRIFQTYRGMAVVVDDAMPVTNGNYTTALFGRGAFGYGMSEPNEAPGTEVENIPSAGNGGGQVVLHSRVNMAMHPYGYSWIETPPALVEMSPTLADLALEGHWQRVYERKAIPLAFLVSKL